MTFEEKLALVARVVDAEAASSWYDTLVRELTDAVYYKHEAEDRSGLYGDETYGDSLIRYHGLGYITNEQIEELWMQAVLAGLHNLKEQDDADW